MRKRTEEDGNGVSVMLCVWAHPLDSRRWSTLNLNLVKWVDVQKEFILKNTKKFIMPKLRKLLDLNHELL